MRSESRLFELLNAELTRGFVFAPVMLGLGILCFFQLREEPGLTLFATIAGTGMLCTIGFFYASYAIRPVFWALALLAFGFVLAAGRSYSVAAPVLDWRYYGPVEGRVIGLDRSASGALRVTLDQVALGLRASSDTPKRVRVSLYGPDAERRPRAGSRIMTTAHLSPPSGPAEPYGFDFQRHAWFGQLGALGYTRAPVLLARAPETGLTFFSLRLALSERVQRHLTGQAGAFAAALMTGDRSGLSEETLQNLRRSNLAHLLAISGLHMGLLAGFVFAVLRVTLALIPPLAVGGWVKKFASLGGLIVATGYLGLSGGSVATERAFIMAAVALCAVMLDRRAISLRAVAVAALIILVRRPEALTGPGFQMSFAATTALVVVFTKLSSFNAARKPQHPVLRLVMGTVISSAVAGLATLPIAAAHFNQIAHYGLIANLVSVPLMGILIIPMAVLSVCVLPLGLEAIPLGIMGLGLDWILAVAQETSHWPRAVSKVPAPPPWAFLSFCLGLVTLALMASHLRIIGLGFVMLGLTGWVQVTRPELLISDTGALVGVMTSEGRALSKDKGAGFVASVWLENDGDQSAQYDAARRWGANASKLFGSRKIHAASGKRGLAAFPGCAPRDIAVFSETFEGNAPCEVFDAKRLRQTGSVAISLTTDGQLKITTARTVAGRRYWNDKTLRKQRLGYQ